MKTSASGITFIKNHETYGGVANLTVYADSKGNPTVGYGHKVLPGDNLKLGDQITQIRADQFFANDLAKVAENPINALACVSKLSQSQFDALASISFNGNGSTVLATNDMKTMLANPKIFPDFIGPLSPSEIDNCSRLVSKAFSFDVTLKPRRNEEATLFCTGEAYTHKYQVYTL